MYGFWNICRGGWGNIGGIPVMGILFVVIAIAALYFVFKNVKKGGAENTAEDILKERLARGDISAQEYRERLKEIRD